MGEIVGHVGEEMLLLRDGIIEVLIGIRGDGDDIGLGGVVSHHGMSIGEMVGSSLHASQSVESLLVLGEGDVDDTSQAHGTLWRRAVLSQI